MSTLKTTNLKTLDDALNIPLTSIALKSELTATTISVIPTGGITQTNVQAALASLDTRVLARQPLDATLTALAGVTTSANTLVYATGVDAFSTSTLTPFARTLLDDPDAATMRATIGVSAVNSAQLSTGWVIFSGATTATMLGNYNISSVSRVSAGLYQINFATAMNNTNYTFTGSSKYGTAAVAVTSFSYGVGVVPTVNNIRVLVTDLAGNPGDAALVSVNFFGGV